MPGYEVIDKQELYQCEDILKKSKTFFRMGFEKKRNGIFKVLEFEKKFGSYFNAKYCLGVTSGTAALRVALASLNLKPNDEVITQAFTFVATAEAIIEANCKPVCANIDDTLNLDPKDLIKKINKKTRAVIVVHMLGVPARMREIVKICKKNKIILIEDTAWGCGGKINNKFLGTIGDIGTYSFDHAKAITTGEGGMVVFKNKNHFLKGKAWHDHGHENNPKFPRWEDTRKSSGFNFRMNELQGAIGIAQLKKLDFITKSQRKNYYLILNSIKDIKGLKERSIPKNSYISADALIIIVKNKKIAMRCRKFLLKSKISTKILPEAYSWHFAGKWSHMKELNKKKNFKNSLKVSEKILSKAVSIPIFVKMTKNQISGIRNSLLKSLK
ncbi:DegT/DnrJ/EryC1/StrS family aminotransferase [Pelagibacterales bacterium SAG-MED05]|nr:DegT/DnrJ/EryC1/StrS family aminotransferase [Pelagibacterales bacterium SAG-MED05]